MTKISATLTALMMVCSFAAQADVLVPSVSTVSGDDAKNLFEKIVEMTGQTPSQLQGTEMVSGKARHLVCTRRGEEYFCKVDVDSEQ